MHYIRYLLLCLLLLSNFSTCKAEKIEIMAQVNDEIITNIDLFARFRLFIFTTQLKYNQEKFKEIEQYYNKNDWSQLAHNNAQIKNNLIVLLKDLINEKLLFQYAENNKSVDFNKIDKIIDQSISKSNIDQQFLKDHGIYDSIVNNLKFTMITEKISGEYLKEKVDKLAASQYFNKLIDQYNNDKYYDKYTMVINPNSKLYQKNKITINDLKTNIKNQKYLEKIKINDQYFEVKSTELNNFNNISNLFKKNDDSDYLFIKTETKAVKADFLFSKIKAIIVSANNKNILNKIDKIQNCDIKKLTKDYMKVIDFKEIDEMNGYDYSTSLQVLLSGVNEGNFSEISKDYKKNNYFKVFICKKNNSLKDYLSQKIYKDLSKSIYANDYISSFRNQSHIKFFYQ